LFTLDIFLKITEVAETFGFLFFTVKGFALSLRKKRVGPLFGRIFSRAYLVTLLSPTKQRQQNKIVFVFRVSNRQLIRNLQEDVTNHWSWFPRKKWRQSRLCLTSLVEHLLSVTYLLCTFEEAELQFCLKFPLHVYNCSGSSEE
jgi:hypothetical protein